MGMIFTRILIVWLYNNTGESVFAAVVFHATNNLSSFLFPNYGSHYDPFIACIIIAGAAAIVTFLWGSTTLARFRYARLGQDVQPRAPNRSAPDDYTNSEVVANAPG
jgi:hypothetical protein